MAGMFYTLEEVAVALGKSEQQVQEMIKSGKLREFRDGDKLLFKVEEVDQLKSSLTGLDMDLAASAIELAPDESGDLNLDTSESMGDIDLAALTGSQMPLGSEINLADLTGADTAIGTTGINVLGETDDGYKLAADSRSETRMAGDSEELSRLDDDVNLDSVGSGSGLLDLSLQADDTSLGAVLDDILPATEGEAGLGSPEDQGTGIAEEADKIFEQSEHQDQLASETQVIMQYVEPEATAFDKACGFALFIPLVAVIVAAIAVVCGFNFVTPSIMSIVKGNGLIIVMSVLIVLFLAVVGIGAILGGKTKDKEEDVYQQQT